MGRRAEGWKLRKPRRPGGFWTVRFTHEGRQREFSTGATDAQEAEARAKLIYAEVVAGTRKAAVSDEDLDVLFAEWLADIETDVHESTLKQYEMYVARHFTTFFGSLASITTKTIAAYQRERLRKVTRTTIKKERSALNGFLLWCVEQGQMEERPALPALPRKAGGTRRHERQTVDLTAEEVERILGELPEQTRHSGKPRAFYTFMWETGLRTATVQRLRTPDEYVRGATELRIPDDKDKARFGRVLPLTPRAIEALTSALPGKPGLTSSDDATTGTRSGARRHGRGSRRRR